MLDQSRDLCVYIGHCWFVGRCALWRSGSWQRGWTARSCQATIRWSRAGSTSRVKNWTCIWRWGDVFRKLSGSYQASKVLEIQPWFWGTTRSRNSRFVAVGFTCVWQVFFSQNLTTPCSASCQTVDSLNSKMTISAMTEHEQKPSTVHRGPWSLCLLYGNTNDCILFFLLKVHVIGPGLVCCRPCPWFVLVSGVPCLLRWFCCAPCWTWLRLWIGWWTCACLVCPSCPWTSHCSCLQLSLPCGLIASSPATSSPPCRVLAWVT